VVIRRNPRFRQNKSRIETLWIRSATLSVPEPLPDILPAAEKREKLSGSLQVMTPALIPVYLLRHLFVTEEQKYPSIDE
jgi:hypothetical protein